MDDPTMLEVLQLAAKSNVALVERGGRMAFCGVANIPEGWHRVGAGVATPGTSYGAIKRAA